MSTSSTQLIVANTHLFLSAEIWRGRIIPLLAFSEIVSLFFQTCHFLRASRFEILSPIAAAEQELMQITPYRGLALPLERIVSLWLRLPSASFRAIRWPIAAQPPIIYAARFENARVFLKVAEASVAFFTNASEKQKKALRSLILELFEVFPKKYHKTCIFVSAYIYLERMANSKLLQKYDPANLMAALICLSMKWHEDDTVWNEDFAKYLKIDVSDFNKIELDCLIALNNSISINADKYEQVRSQLLERD